uniref:Maturase K n=1 Tax=Panagrolaimus davidi TaxID=227884 RepID=A0A914PQ70_9BILA
MEPMNLLSHLRGIFLKMENEYYLDFLLQENSVRSTILESFMPDSLSNDRIYQIPNAEREARKDRRIKPGDSMKRK